MDKQQQKGLQVILTICEEVKFNSSFGERQEFFSSSLWKDIQTWLKVEWMVQAKYALHEAKIPGDIIHAQGEAYRLLQIAEDLPNLLENFIKAFRKEENDGGSAD